MSVYEKPYQQYDRQQEYQKYLERINEIVNRNNRFNKGRNIANSVKSNKGQYDRLQKKKLLEENIRIVERIEQIHKRKIVKDWLPKDRNKSEMKKHVFDNKKQKRKISLQNKQIADRLISKHSDIKQRRNRIMKNIDEYQSLRKSLIKNKRIVAPLYSARYPSAIELHY